jgi:hypothetical protein
MGEYSKKGNKMTIRVVNKKTFRGKGYYIGRPSALGNPFTMKNESERDSVIAKYKEWFYQQLKNNENVKLEIRYLCELHSRGEDINLICWCAPKACHGDVIKKYIERDAK